MNGRVGIFEGGESNGLKGGGFSIIDLGAKNEFSSLLLFYWGRNGLLFCHTK